MNSATRVPTLWNQLAEAMYLKDSITARVTLSEHSSSAFARVQSSKGLPDIARPIVREEGFIVALQLKAIPFMEQFFGRTKVSSGSYPIGAVSAIDLRDEPAVLLPHPFDALVVYVTQASLDEVAYAHGAPRVEQLAWPLGQFDPVVYHLARTLLSSLEQPQHTSKLVVDHVLHALTCHFVCSYGGVKTPPPQFRGGLSSVQKRRATELLEANLDGKISLHQVAEACDLSVGHFARAFRHTFRRPPYKWLIERRVDKARDLMTNSRLSLADIAIQSGFADQSALNRTFKRLHGVAPGTWRRTTARDAFRSGSYSGADAAPRQQLSA
ncbi:MAG TPA: AraC family transcriptional regulator [Nitrospira sp.]|nr:AraC family transcriptional regulator [Nitrospira sp.]